jgi:hypothetical protein
MVAWIQKFNRKTASVYKRTFVWPSSLIHEITLFQIGIRPTIYPAIWPSFSVSWRSPIEFVPTYFHTAAIQGLDGAWNSLWMRWAGISKTDGLEEHGWSAAWLNSLPHFLPMTNWLPPAQMDCKIVSNSLSKNGRKESNTVRPRFTKTYNTKFRSHELFYIMKHIPSAWLFFRTRTRSSRIFRIKLNTW